MHVFADSHGRKWEVEINIHAVKQVRAHLKVNLLDAPSGELMGRIGDDILLLVDILGVLCAGQAASAGISDEQFASAIRGDVFDDARLAFGEELAEFFPERTSADDDADSEPLDAAGVEGLVDRLAGIAGVDPGPLTLRQLARMARARREDEWERCSYLLAKIHNCNRAADTHAVSPDDMNPLNKKAAAKKDESPVLARMSIRDLRPAIMGAMGKQAQQAGLLRKPAQKKP